MAAVAIALNRFGLGARVDEPLAGDPKRWLLGQFDRFEPRPAVLRAVPGRAEVAADLANVEAQRRMGRRDRKAMPDQPASAERAAGKNDGARTSAASELRGEIRGHYSLMNSARLMSALTTQTPFLERLVHFWANHFAISGDKLPTLGLAGLLEFEAVRPNVLGRFSDMLIAVEQHPAMLVYLNQAQSIGPESQVGRLTARRGKKRGLNENLAREILELHTVGVNGGYTQADVTEFARALTGWTVSGIGGSRTARFVRESGPPGSFAFAEALHEPGARRIMGRVYAQLGAAQAHAVLGDLALHPSTARFLATKLSRHFAGDEPPSAMVDRLARAYLSSGGDLPTVYRAIIDSPEAWAERPAKFKSPWEWTVSSMRALGAREVRRELGTRFFVQLGQPTWRPGSPAGWGDTAAAWTGPDAMLRRVDAVQRLTAGAGAELDPRAVAARVLPGGLSDATRTAIERAESPQQGLALLLVSPEFMRR